jgi:tetratricopeptide (TPR) repeat protein
LLELLPEIATRFDPTAVTGAAPPAAGFFALAAIPARYALERAAWNEAVALTPKRTPFPFTDAMTHFARALGAAHLQQTATIRESVDALQDIRDRLRQAREDYWAEQVEIQRLAASAWLAQAEGRTSDAMAQMRTAAEREDATEKNAMTPGPLAPARELLGEMLLGTGDAPAALKEFEATMKKEPNRFRALAGAAKAAAAAGDRTKAATYYAQLLKMCARANAGSRPELADARAFVTRTSGR